MFDMKVVGFSLRTVSTTNRITVGNLEAKDSVMIVPDADQVNTSTCPGVSNSTYLDRGQNIRRNVTPKDIAYLC